MCLQSELTNQKKNKKKSKKKRRDDNDEIRRRRDEKEQLQIGSENLLKKKQDRDEKSVLIECTKEDEDFRPLDFQHDHLRIHINRCDIRYSTLTYIRVRQMGLFYSFALFFLLKTRQKIALCAS